MNTFKNESHCAVAIKKALNTCLLILFYMKILPTPTFVEQVSFQKLPFFNSSFAKNFERFDNFMNFLYSD